MKTNDLTALLAERDALAAALEKCREALSPVETRTVVYGGACFRHRADEVYIPGCPACAEVQARRKQEDSHPR